MDQSKIGSFLKKLRRERNLTQEELAEKLEYIGPLAVVTNELFYQG